MPDRTSSQQLSRIPSPTAPPSWRLSSSQRKERPLPFSSPSSASAVIAMQQRDESPPTKAAETETGDPPPPVHLLYPSQTKKKAQGSAKLFRAVRSAFRSFPILNPACRFAAGVSGGGGNDGHVAGAARMTGTLFGLRKARITLAIQENPRSQPLALLDLPIATAKLLQEMGAGLVRIAMECEKKHAARRTKLLEEPMWTMYCNGRRAGGAARREPSEADLNVMKLLHAVSMGAGVLPGGGAMDGELTYMRAHFDRAVGSRDSETFYMLNPDGNGGPELTIFFIRI